MLSVYATSLQYVQVPVTNTQGVNPTGDVVQFAFLGPYGNVSQCNDAIPTSATTYYTGSWQSTTSPYIAACLVGPGGGVVTLTTGTYLVVVKVTDNPEVPIIFSGPMVVS